MGSNILFAEYPDYGVTVRRPLLSDLDYLAENLRPDDVRELEAHGTSVEESLHHGLTASDRAFVATKDGHPILIFGVVTHEEEGLRKGAVWMVGTPEMRSITRLFVMHSKSWIGELARGYDLLWNYVDCRNSLHHRWLEWCGFSFLRVVPMRPRNLPFYEFAKRV